MKYEYQTTNTCSKTITFELENDIVTNVQFLGGGCPGNLQALPRLVEGMTVSEIESRIGGVICGRRGTSCADQLVRAIKEAYNSAQ